MKKKQIERGKETTLLFADHDIFAENPMGSIKNNSYKWTQHGWWIQKKNQSHFYILTMNMLKSKFKTKCHLKEIKYLGIYTQEFYGENCEVLKK